MITPTMTTTLKNDNNYGNNRPTRAQTKANRASNNPPGHIEPKTTCPRENHLPNPRRSKQRNAGEVAPSREIFSEVQGTRGPLTQPKATSRATWPHRPETRPDPQRGTHRTLRGPEPH